MSFARGSQAQDETEGARGQPGLVGVRDDGRIEQRRRLKRILMRKIGADERLPLRQKLPPLAQAETHLREAGEEMLFKLLVAIGKFTQHPAQQPSDVLV